MNGIWICLLISQLWLMRHPDAEDRCSLYAGLWLFAAVVLLVIGFFKVLK